MSCLGFGPLTVLSTKANMTDEEIQFLRQALPVTLFQAVLIEGYLREFWEKTPINPIDDFDLNPHLWIKRICQEIAEKVSRETPCSQEDVMLLWLTMAVYNNMFLPSPAK